MRCVGFFFCFNFLLIHEEITSSFEVQTISGSRAFIFDGLGEEGRAIDWRDLRRQGHRSVWKGLLGVTVARNTCDTVTAIEAHHRNGSGRLHPCLFTSGVTILTVDFGWSERNNLGGLLLCGIFDTFDLSALNMADLVAIGSEKVFVAGISSLTWAGSQAFETP